MTDIQLSDYSVEELTELEHEIHRERTRRDQERREEARRRIQEIAKEYDMPVDELVGAETTSSKKAKSPKASNLPPKYRNPADPTETWSGRGRRPDWYKAALASGVEPASMEI